jgi:hypothetical protein
LAFSANPATPDAHTSPQLSEPEYPELKNLQNKNEKICKQLFAGRAQDVPLAEISEG